MTVTQNEAKQALAFFSGANFSSAQPKFERKKNDEGEEVLHVTGMPVFRSGSFRDSMGYEHTYDGFHMDQMVSNFSLLTAKSILMNLPVRAGHPSPFTNYMHEMIGHLVGLSTGDFVSPADGETYTYLLADFTVFDSTAAEHIEKKHWTNRSAEIGMYSTNDGMDFYPAFMGFAYVDIPAVEGLNFHSDNRFNKNFVVACDDGIKEEVDMSGSNQGAGSFEFSLATGKTTDFAAVQAHVTAIEGENEALKTKNGELEAFQKETTTANRANFVKGLISSNKVLASQETDLNAYVGSLSAEQFAQYQSIMDGAPQVPLLASHATTDSTGGTPDANQATETDVELENAKRIYDRHKAAGMPVAQLKQTASYKVLVAKGEIKE